MRKTILYLVVLGILGFAIYYFLISNNDTSYNTAEAGFTVKDTGNIGRIFLVSNDGEAITLDRTDSGWVVNKKYKALASTLDLLMTTMYQQAPLYPVTKAAYEDVVKTLSTDGTKIELYGRDGKKIKVFYVGGVALNNTGTNMLMDGAKMPYVVQVPGFVGYLSSRYTTKLTDWRDRTVFNIPQSEIKSISMHYDSKPGNSFLVTRENDSFTVKPEDDKLVKGAPGQNSRRAKIYATYFSDVNCEGYLNGLPDMDTTLRTAPKQSTIDIIGLHGQHQHADIYWMAINKRSKNVANTPVDVPEDYDADRLYAVINNSRDTVMIQQYAFRNIFRKAGEFFQGDAAPVRGAGVHRPV